MIPSASIRAAQILEDEAALLRDSHTVNGCWPESEADTRDYCAGMLALAVELRAQDVATAAEIERLRNDTVPGMAARFAALEAERDRLRAALYTVSTMTVEAFGVSHHPGIVAEMVAGVAQMAKDVLAEASVAPKRAYYETHEPPHCPSCQCDGDPDARDFFGDEP